MVCMCRKFICRGRVTHFIHDLGRCGSCASCHRVSSVRFTWSMTHHDVRGRPLYFPSWFIRTDLPWGKVIQLLPAFGNFASCQKSICLFACRIIYRLGPVPYFPDIEGLPMCVLSYIFAWHRGSSGQRPWVRLLHSLVHCHLARLCEDLFSAAIRDRERSSRG